MEDQNAGNEREVYARQAEQYERLIRREDYQGNILPALAAITSLRGKQVVELGAGTGRLTRLLAPLVRSIHAFDLSAHMLRLAGSSLVETGLHNWGLALADHRRLPVKGAVADVIIAGWSVCYLVTWNPSGWQADLQLALDEMERVLRPGGTILLLETLGTGHEMPNPPKHLLEYYRYLEGHGFQSTWIRTDYRFASLEEAEQLSRFFFGDELARAVVEKQWKTLPECTGIWWKQISDRRGF